MGGRRSPQDVYKRQARITIRPPPIKPLGLVGVRPVRPPAFVECAGDNYELVESDVGFSVFFRTVGCVRHGGMRVDTEDSAGVFVTLYPVGDFAFEKFLSEGILKHLFELWRRCLVAVSYTHLF